MDETTIYLSKRMDDGFEALRQEIRSESSSIQEEIKELQRQHRSLEGFRNRILGGAFVVSFFVTVSVEFILSKLK